MFSQTRREFRSLVETDSLKHNVQIRQASFYWVPRIFLCPRRSFFISPTDRLEPSKPIQYSSQIMILLGTLIILIDTPSKRICIISEKDLPLPFPYRRPERTDRPRVCVCVIYLIITCKRIILTIRHCFLNKFNKL